MATALAHRGPDDAGVWADERSGAVLSFRRLAILDLSPEGHQPMSSSDGRFTIVFNGEIYNFQDLRKDLENRGHRFRGHSDTEVILAAFVEWGIAEAINKLNGMFAIAVWDAARREMTLVRDRIGKKPLYYGQIGNIFLFGSELKGLRAHPEFTAEVNREALTLYLQFGYVPSPYSIYQNIYKLAPGKMLKVYTETGVVGEQTTYWSVHEAAAAGLENQFNGTADEIIGELDALLRDSVKRRMLADVPLGAFLSGGTDSSLIVALMQAQSSQPVKTFSIGFDEAEYNEAEHAKRVAKYLGTEHQELYLTMRESQDVIPQLPVLYDEPFADSSQIPTYLVSVLARQKVTVALSGDGGDELFGGYGRYLLACRLWEKVNSVPSFLRPTASFFFNSAANLTNRLVPINRGQRKSNLPQKLKTLAGVTNVTTDDLLYKNLISHWQNAETVVLNNNLKDLAFNNNLPENLDFFQRMMLQDAHVYLPDDILVKVDRASMGVSLETRAPLLDYRVVEFAWRVPLNLKLREGTGKWLLRELLNRYIPSSITERPKMGFDVPIAQWLRKDLREWAENLINDSRLRQEGFFQPEAVQKKWLEHLSGKLNHQQSLWSILMFQEWFSYWHK